MAVNITSISSDPRILALDVEMSKTISYHYGQMPRYIRHEDIKQRPFLISCAWQWIGQDKIHCVSVLDDPKRFENDHTDDFHVIRAVHDEMREADAIIAYNGVKFDVKEINTAIAKNNLDPLHEYITLDPYQIARRRFRMDGKGGNSLDHLCGFFELGVEKGKVTNKDWNAAADGCPEAIGRIVEYNKGDIPTMIAVWDKVKVFAPSKLNMNHWTNTDGVTCSHCGSANMKIHKVRKTARATIKHQYQCQDCGGYTTSGKSIKTQEYR